MVLRGDDVTPCIARRATCTLFMAFAVGYGVVMSRSGMYRGIESCAARIVFLDDFFSHIQICAMIDDKALFQW